MFDCHLRRAHSVSSLEAPSSKRETEIVRFTFGFTLAVVSSVPAIAIAQETGMAGMHEQRREGGKTCMSSHVHTGSGSGPTKDAARQAAIRSWIDFTAFEYGNAWASFANAAAATTRYTKEESGWSATVDARPCRRK